MGPARVQKGFLQILPMLGAALAAWSSVATAQESFPNELNSPVDEPQVIVREQSDKVPVRMASQEIQQSSDPLVKLAWETREATRRRLLSTSQHTPWQMMHGLLGLRHDFLISHDGAAVNGLEWIRTGPMYQNEPWFQKTVHGGRAHPFSKPYWFEGHINQSLAILSQCELPLDTTFGTPNGPITMRDMLKNAQMTVNEKEEVTWTLWALCTYLPPDAKWVNAKGEQWSIERLVQVEVGKPVGGPTSPCGGTHGLYALARARNIYMATGKPLRGVWYQADQKIKKYIQVARNNQNANGTLSSAFFKGKEYKQDFDKRMASTGHQLEFLMMAVDDRTLREPWLRRAVEATANDLMANRKEYVSCSPLYHATNAMTLYLERTVPSQRQQNMAQRPTAKTISSSKELAATPQAQTSPGTVPQTGPGTVPPIPKVSSATSTTVKSASAPSANPSTSSNATPQSTTPTGTAAAAMPQVAPALKSTPPVGPSVASQSSSSAEKTTPSESTPSDETGTSKESNPQATENPLTPVPLPDLTIPVEPAKSADPMTNDPATPATSASSSPEITPKTDDPSDTSAPKPMPTAVTNPSVPMPAGAGSTAPAANSGTPAQTKPAEQPPAALPSAATASLTPMPLAPVLSAIVPGKTVTSVAPPIAAATVPDVAESAKAAPQSGLESGTSAPVSAATVSIPIPLEPTKVPALASSDSTNSSVPFDAIVDRSEHVVSNEPIVSAERPADLNASNEIVPLLAPLPLKKISEFAVQKPSVDQPAASGSGSVPVKSVSSSVDATLDPGVPTDNSGLTATPVATAISPTVVLPSGNSPPSPANTGAMSVDAKSSAAENPNSADGKRSEGNPTQKSPVNEKHRWKATPMERRRMTIQSGVKTSG